VLLLHVVTCTTASTHTGIVLLTAVPCHRTHIHSLQICASYAKDECQLRVTIKLPSAYPLRGVEVSCDKKLGISDARWRRWVLQIVTLLSVRDGSVLDAVLLWKRNVDKVSARMSCTLFACWYCVLNISLCACAAVVAPSAGALTHQLTSRSVTVCAFSLHVCADASLYDVHATTSEAHLMTSKQYTSFNRSNS
jgi:hypothetical protein